MRGLADLCTNGMCSSVLALSLRDSSKSADGRNEHSEDDENGRQSVKRDVVIGSLANRQGICQLNMCGVTFTSRIETQLRSHTCALLPAINR